MKLGLLWFDDDKQRSLAEKVEGAAMFYANKYGTEPNCCHVNPTMLNGESAANGVVLVGSSLVLIEHLWIGVEDNG